MRPLILVACLVLAALSTLLPTYYAGLAVYACVLAMLGTAVNIAFGYLGLISFGHAAFFGLGAYAAGLLTVKLGFNYWLAIPLSLLPCILLGVVVGCASLRLGGPYFAIGTLAAAEILRLTALNWVDLTRGPLGIVVPRPRIPALESIGLSFNQYHLLICLAALAFVLLVISRMMNSPFGRAWLALRDQPALAESVGINALRYRVGAMALSAGIAGFAGALLVPKILVLSPDLFGVTQSANGLLVAILGGRGTLLGPVLGGIIFAVVPETFRFVDDYRIAIFALILLFVVRLRPDGLASLLPRLKFGPIDTPGVAAIAKVPVVDESLVIDGISRSFGGVQAVQNVAFQVSSGEIVGLIGPNGAGKTTCLSLFSGFMKPNRGTVTFGGKRLDELPPYEVARLGLVRTFQHTAVCASLSAYENAKIATHLLAVESFFAVLLRMPAFRQRERERALWAAACLARVGLKDRGHVEAGALAYGEQRMLSIALAIAAKPRFLLLDEPAAGLNQTEAGRLTDLLRDLRQDGYTIVVVDHNVRMLMNLCDRIIVLHHGQKLADDTPQAVRKLPAVVNAYLGTKWAVGASHAPA